MEITFGLVIFTLKTEIIMMNSTSSLWDFDYTIKKSCNICTGERNHEMEKIHCNRVYMTKTVIYITTVHCMKVWVKVESVEYFDSRQYEIQKVHVSYA